MSIFNKISVFIISLIFLFSSTGLVLIHHECNSCEVSEYLINKEHTHKKIAHQENNCCKETECIPVKEQITHNESDCCNNDVFYIKINEPFLSYSFSVDFYETIIQLFDYDTIDFSDILYSKNRLFTSIEKPPEPAGREILRLNCILRV